MASGPVPTTTVRWLDGVCAADLEKVGRKGASLGELTDAGLPVLPVLPGFMITAEGCPSKYETSDLLDFCLHNCRMTADGV